MQENKRLIKAVPPSVVVFCLMENNNVLGIRYNFNDAYNALWDYLRALQDNRVSNKEIKSVFYSDATEPDVVENKQDEYVYLAIKNYSISVIYKYKDNTINIKNFSIIPMALSAFPDTKIVTYKKYNNNFEIINKLYEEQLINNF